VREEGKGRDNFRVRKSETILSKRGRKEASQEGGKRKRVLSCPVRPRKRRRKERAYATKKKGGPASPGEGGSMF